MKSIRSILKLSELENLSLRAIGSAVNQPHTTVKDYITRYKVSDLTMKDVDQLSDQELYGKLFPLERRQPPKPQPHSPDYSWVHTELRRSHVTRQLLWEEYRKDTPDGLSYSQFCQNYLDYKKTITISMRQTHRAGEKLFVDYAGTSIPYTDPLTGVVHKTALFIAVLGASGDVYAECSADQSTASFVQSHIQSLEYFEGAPKILVPDNLKSAVIKADLYDPQLNSTYRDMAEYYGMVVIPARVRKPKDKAKAELGVGLVERWIVAALRNRIFHSLQEINEAIWDLLDRVNSKIIRGLGKSRHDLYLELDKPALQALPTEPYILREMKQCRVNIDYHIQLEGAYYSVPYQLAHREVTAIYSTRTVEIYHDNTIVATHPRHTRKGAVSTHSEHMASSHRAWAEFSPSRLIGWAANYGPFMKQLIQDILISKPHPELGFRTCLGILNHAKGIDSPVALEMTAQMMLELKSYKVAHFKDILKSKRYLPAPEERELPLPQQHANLRSPDSFR